LYKLQTPVITENSGREIWNLNTHR